MSMDLEWEPPSDTLSITCDGVTDDFFEFEINRIKVQAQTLLDRVNSMEQVFKKRSAEQRRFSSYTVSRIHELERSLAKAQSKE